MARTPREKTAASFAPEESTRPGAKAFAEIAAKSKGFRPAREVLRRVRAVPTIFPGIDYKLRVGGWPTERIAVVHGPSGMGKTVLVQGVGFSFLKRGHGFALIDAEHSTPHTWLQAMMGAYADSPLFVASRPANYEQAVDDVQRHAEGIGEAKAKGRLPPDTSCFFAVDSLDRLMPVDVIERMKKHAAENKDGSVDGYSGASGMIQAAMNKAWLSRLVPLMHDTGCAIALIARETDDRNASANDRKWGNDWKVVGGRALKFDSSLSLRVAHAKMIHEDERDYKSPVVGELHLVEIRKTKVSARESEVERCWFSTSTGAITPAGFDRARDLLELGTDLEVIKGSGAWYAFGGKRWQGKNQFLKKASPETLDAIEAACRAKFGAEERADVVGATP